MIVERQKLNVFDQAVDNADEIRLDMMMGHHLVRACGRGLSGMASDRAGRRVGSSTPPALTLFEGALKKQAPENRDPAVSMRGCVAHFCRKIGLYLSCLGKPLIQKRNFQVFSLDDEAAVAFSEGVGGR